MKLAFQNLALPMFNRLGYTILDSHRWPAGQQAIVLTFDDGPNPKDEISRRLLDVLEYHAVQAVFCYIGRNVDDSPAIARRAYEAGHQLVPHTYTHALATLLSAETLHHEIRQTEQALRQAATQPTLQFPYFRPPLGLKTPTVERVIRQRGLTYAHLTFYVNDAPTQRAEWPHKIHKIKRQLAHHQGGAIVLHERRYRPHPTQHNAVDKSWLPAAVDDLIQWGKRNGYRFVLYPPNQAGLDTE